MTDMVSEVVYSGQCWFLNTFMANKLNICITFIQMKVSKSISDTCVIQPEIGTCVAKSVEPTVLRECHILTCPVDHLLLGLILWLQLHCSVDLFSET